LDPEGGGIVGSGAGPGATGEGGPARGADPFPMPEHPIARVAPPSKKMNKIVLI